MAGNRSKKAEKVARTRLSKAAQLLKENNRDAYYEEVLRTLWNYTGHRLHIAMADLNKENATTALQKSGVSNETTGNLIALIHQCEFARYAPPGSSHEMQDDFSSAINVIRKIEEEMK